MFVDPGGWPDSDAGRELGADVEAEYVPVPILSAKGVREDGFEIERDWGTRKGGVWQRTMRSRALINPAPKGRNDTGQCEA